MFDNQYSDTLYRPRCRDKEYLKRCNNVLYRINKLFWVQNKTQRALVEYLGVGRVMMTEWNSGSTTTFLKYIDGIAEFFGVSVDYLLEDDDSTTFWNSRLSKEIYGDKFERAFAERLKRDRTGTLAAIGYGNRISSK